MPRNHIYTILEKDGFVFKKQKSKEIILLQIKDFKTTDL